MMYIFKHINSLSKKEVKMNKEESKDDNQYSAKLVILYYMLLPIYLILQLKIGIKAHFIIPIIYLGIIIKNYKKFNFKYLKYIIVFFMFQLPYSIWQYYNYLYNWFGLMYLLFICSLPWFVVGNSLNNLNEIIEVFKKNVYLILLSNIALIIFCILTGRPMLGNMEISYTILPLLLLSLLIFLNEKKIKFLMIALFSCTIVVIMGSRGTLLCIASFLIMYYIINFKKEFFHVIIIVTLLIGIIWNFNNILAITINKFESWGISSRTLYKLENGDILNDTGRGKIQKVVIEALNEHPILGLGIGGERIIVNDKIYKMTKDMSTCYPHNLIIEIIAQYGYLVGTMLIVFLIGLLVNTIKNTNGNERNILLLLVSQEIIKLLVSSSYIISPMFFLVLGICFYKVREK
ncbi:MAG: O-antigen ligase domain-containing protein [Clostridiales bacterium]|nr:O-antigen ligase domain-containing protein [Clostridiales bacterium]